MTDTVDRRTFLRRGAVSTAGLALVGGGGLSAILAACSSDSKTATGAASSSGGKPSLGTLDFQLSWIKNVEFAAEYLADTNGYYAAEGFTGANLMSGGPSVQQDAVVASGKAFIGISAPDIAAAAINSGAEIICIGAQYQKNPFAVVSLASKPIKTPAELAGKKIGVQSVNEPVWNAFLKANNIDPSTINKIPAQFDPQPLANGEADGWFSFVTNEPNLLKTKGVDTYSLLLNDFGYPLVSEVYIVGTAALKNERNKVKAVLRADIKGWHDSIKDPAAAPHLVVTKYGSDLGLDEAEQTLESRAQNLLVLTDETKANGLFTISDKLLAETMSTLKLAGVTIDQSKLFDMSVIKEVYAENPELKTSPTPG